VCLPPPAPTDALCCGYLSSLPSIPPPPHPPHPSAHLARAHTHTLSLSLSLLSLSGLLIPVELQQYPEETLNIIKATFSAAVIGWMYGGLPAFHHAKTQYIEQSQAEIFQNRLDAVQSAHRAAIRGFIRYGWRWSWRIATFVAIFNTVSTGLSVYRNKTTFSHFAAAGGEITLFLYCVLITAGGVLMAMEKLAGESIQEKRLRERRLLHEQKLAEWDTEGCLGWNDMPAHTREGVSHQSRKPKTLWGTVTTISIESLPGR
uniref:Complex I assembly factor TIMMDC1, mitochondrial n=1 Tax=Chelonoidis abingdonii TaxID=106734 RepID=A0A8C0GI43_CHEAB